MWRVVSSNQLWLYVPTRKACRVILALIVDLTSLTLDEM
jgi:hypothetical protein